MKKEKVAFVSLIALLVFAGCSSSREEQRLQCNTVRYVNEFPQEVELGESVSLSLDLAGCVDVMSFDSLLICKFMDAPYLWKVYSLNSLNLLGELLGRGHGHDEFMELPLSEMFLQTDSALYCDFWNSSKRMWYRCNLTKSLQQKEMVFEAEQRFENYDDLARNVRLNDSLFYFIQYNGYMGYIRSLYCNGHVEPLSHVGNLNELLAEEDLNTFSAVRCVNRNRMKAAEAMLRLNQINLYSLDSDSCSLTLCMGTELMNVTEVDRSKSKRHKHYGYIASYDDYFVALYDDIPFRDFQEGNGQVQLQFFDWQGNPLLRMKLPFLATAFFISDDRYLYVFSNAGEEEQLYKYDCRKLLENLEK